MSIKLDRVKRVPDGRLPSVCERRGRLHPVATGRPMGCLEVLHHAVAQGRTKAAAPFLALIQRIIVRGESEGPTGSGEAVVCVAQVPEVGMIPLLNQQHVAIRDQLSDELFELWVFLEQLIECAGEAGTDTVTRFAPFVGLRVRSRNQRSKSPRPSIRMRPHGALDHAIKHAPVDVRLLFDVIDRHAG